MASGRPSDPAPDAPQPEKPAGSDSTRAGRRAKRAAPTIDLKATEIPDETARASASASNETARESRFDEPPFGDSRQNPPRFTPRDALSTSSIAAGLAGGLLVSIVLFVLWLTGLVPIRYAGSTAMRARVSVLEMQVQELSKGGVAADAKNSEELAQRVGKLEQSPAAAVDPKLTERLDNAENAMKALGVALTALNNRVEGNAARVEATEKAAADNTRATASSDGALASRVEALEKAATDAQAAVAKAKSDERVARLAVASSALRDAVVSGEPFTAELAAAKSLGADAPALTPLESFAAAGVPREAALSRELSALLPQVMKSAGVNETPQNGSFLDRLQANASKLVRVRPAGETAGTDTSSILARLEHKSAQGDVAGSLTELKALPSAARAPAEDWIKKAEARRAAIDASRKFAADSLRALQ